MGLTFVHPQLLLYWFTEECNGTMLTFVILKAKFSSFLGNGVSRETPSPCPSTVESCEGEQVLKKPKVARLGFFAQLWVFIRREFVLQLRMSRTFLLDQALTMIAGAVLGLLFREVRSYLAFDTC